MSLPSSRGSIAVYPGSFDPVTYGHLDLVERALDLFDRVIFAIAPSESKRPLFTPEERRIIAGDALKPFGSRVEVTVFDGLLVDFARDKGAGVLIRGLRAVADFEFEFQMALMNRKLAPTVQTIFLMPKEQFIYLSSSIIKEIARLHGDISSFVPPNVEKALKDKLAWGKR